MEISRSDDAQDPGYKSQNWKNLQYSGWKFPDLKKFRLPGIEIPNN